MAWEQRRSTVESLIATGMLERVPPNLDAARSLVQVAERHLASALALAQSDIVLAYDALHGANRKALTAILLAQGLRPTRAGGHIAVYDAVRAQLEPPLGRDLSALPPGPAHAECGPLRRDARCRGRRRSGRPPRLPEDRRHRRPRHQPDATLLTRQACRARRARRSTPATSR